MASRPLLVAVLGCAVLLATGCNSFVNADADAGAPENDAGAPAIIECTESTDCGEHEECVTVGIDSLCECVVGYEGEPCVFVGTLLSPGFGDATPWQGINGAVHILAAVANSLRYAFEAAANALAGRLAVLAHLARGDRTGVPGQWQHGVG